MAIALVPRGVRALADQINAYYRLLTGAQPGSIILRLSGGGGKLEVRHSGTNASIFTVTDSGATGTISAADGSVTNAKLAADAVTTDKIKDNEIRNADIFTGAGILLSKLEGGTAGLVRSNGSVITSGNQVAAADLPTAASAVVDSARIVDLTIVNGDISATAGIVPSKLAAVTANQVLRDVGSGVVGGGLIRDANVDAAGTANIALNKLANVGANNIVKDVGLGVTGAGLLVDANVTNGTLTPAKLNAGGTGFRVLRTQDGVTAVWGQVVSNDITGGAPPPNGSGAPDAWKVYGTDSAGTTVTLQKVDSAMLVANAATRAITSGNWSQTGLTATTFTQVHASSAVTLTGATGAPVLVFIVGTLLSNTSGATTSVGLSLDGAAPATASTGQSTLNYNVPYTVMWLFPSPTAGNRVFSAVYQVQAGSSATISGNIMVLELRK